MDNLPDEKDAAPHLPRASAVDSTSAARTQDGNSGLLRAKISHDSRRQLWDLAQNMQAGLSASGTGNSIVRNLKGALTPGSSRRQGFTGKAVCKWLIQNHRATTTDEAIAIAQRLCRAGCMRPQYSRGNELSSEAMQTFDSKAVSSTSIRWIVSSDFRKDPARKLDHPANTTSSGLESSSDTESRGGKGLPVSLLKKIESDQISIDIAPVTISRAELFALISMRDDLGMSGRTTFVGGEFLDLIADEGAAVLADALVTKGYIGFAGPTVVPHRDELRFHPDQTYQILHCPVSDALSEADAPLPRTTTTAIDQEGASSETSAPPAREPVDAPARVGSTSSNNSRSNSTDAGRNAAGSNGGSRGSAGSKHSRRSTHGQGSGIASVDPVPPSQPGMQSTPKMRRRHVPSVATEPHTQRPARRSVSSGSSRDADGYATDDESDSATGDATGNEPVRRRRSAISVDLVGPPEDRETPIASAHLDAASAEKLTKLRDASTKLDLTVYDCKRKLGHQLKQNESDYVRECWRYAEHEMFQVRESLQDLRSGRWALNREIRSLGLSLSSHRDFLGTMAHEVELLSEQVSENRDWRSWTKNKMIPAGLRLVSLFLGMVLTGRSIWLGQMKPIVRRYGTLGKAIVVVMTTAVLFATWYVLTFIKWIYIYVALFVFFLYTITA